MLELDLPESSASPAFDPTSIDDRSDADLDALRFGVIGLDDEGTILRYNLYESRFARLDRNQVIGKNFFADVAHCTRNDAFEGRFRAFAAQKSGQSLERFDFVFDFKFGAQEVSVEIVRSVDSRFYLLISRKAIEGPRPHVPKEQLAAAQSDLAPDEDRRGVRRDDLERRMINAPAPFFAALRATCDRLAPSTWQLFAAEWGVQWGRRAAVDLEASALERGATSLRDLPMREAARLVSDYFSDRGWGSPIFDFSAVNEGLLVVELDRSALAEAAPRARKRDGAALDRSCHLVAGCLAGILSSIAGRRLAGREITCVASGDATCAIAIFGHERRGAADAALAQGAHSVDELRSALRRAPRSGESR